MPQHVRMRIDRQSLAGCPELDAALHQARADAAAPRGDEQGSVVRRAQGLADRQPAADGFDGMPADWHNAGLAALASHPHFSGGKIDAAEVQPGDLGHAQSG